MGKDAWRHRIGQAGEQLAADLLTRAGYRVLHRRYRRRGGEIDLVAVNEDHLVFVEVKARTAAAHGSPSQAVDRRKRHHLARAARHYLREFGRHGRAVRFDVIALHGNRTGRLRVEWIEDAFRP